MELTMQEKLKLISFFELLLDNEVSKPLGEMDSKSVDAYIKILMNLQDMHIELSPEFIDEQVRKIFHKEEKTALPEAVKTTKKYFNKKKVWLVAACIAILVALFSIVSVASDWDIFDFLTKKFGLAVYAPIEEKQDFNGITVIHHGKNTNYSTVEEALKTVKLNILYPSVLPKDLTVTDIVVSEEKSSEKLYFTFNDLELFFDISFHTLLSESTKQDATETLVINGITCYVCNMSDTNCTQIEFEYNGNAYYLSHPNKDTLIKIIEHLEEINYED